MTGIADYWNALDRLVKGQPVIVPAGSAINNDTVAMEAGRKRGSIKRSRNSFIDLMAAIDHVSENTANEVDKLKDKLLNEKTKKSNYKALYHEALNRELMLIERLANLEKQLLKYVNVIPIV